VPQVELTSISWGELSLQEATAVLNLRVKNPNAFPADLNRLAYGLSLAGQPIVETGLPQGASFSAGGSQDLQIPVSFRPADLGLAVMRILTGDGATYRLGGTMSFDTPYGPIELPFEKSGETAFMR
jgi:LEA14-like dessication related protein